jgi:hypothetical protein
MLETFSNILFTPYIQAILFFVLMGLFALQRRKFQFLSTGLSWLRTLILVVLFLYFAWSWATSIPPSLRAAAVFGMFFINLNMIYNLFLGRLNETYQQALDAYGKDIGNKIKLDNLWKTGKRYIHSRYIFDALFSGYSPSNFLQGVISRQIPADIESVLIKHGIRKEVVTHQKLMAYLSIKLDQSPELPKELKVILSQTIQQFDSHAWIQQHVDEFLQLALKDPEKLYHATWNGAPLQVQAAYTKIAE